MSEEEIAALLPRFIEDVNRLQPRYSFKDRLWYFPLRTGPKPDQWTMIHVTHYEQTYYCHWTEWDFSLEVDSKGTADPYAVAHLNEAHAEKFLYALKWLTRATERIGNDWIRVYRETLRDLPLDMRFGLIPWSVIWHYYPDWYRPDQELGKRHTAQFITLSRGGRFHESFEGQHPEMTLALYLKYCKIAYLANAGRDTPVNKAESGLELYKRYADGRHEGLIDLPADSAEAFHQWYHGGRGGGHPWEVYRGGNTTHIDLGVVERHQGWSIFLRGSSTGRMVETIKIALALAKAELPVELHDAEDLALRLLGMDNLGIIPRFIINHRAAQHFEKEDKVFDCAHLRDFPRKNRVFPYVSWKLIEPVRPRMG